MAAAVTSLLTGTRAQVCWWFAYEDRRDFYTCTSLRCSGVHHVAFRNSSTADRFPPDLSFTWWPLHRGGVHRWTQHNRYLHKRGNEKHTHSALKKLEEEHTHSALTHVSCSPDFPRASYFDVHTLAYEPLVK